LALVVSCDPGIIPPHVVSSEELHARTQPRFCHTCQIIKPPQASHCSACDYCVEEFDHHCGVLGSCVAKRTFRFFAGFLLFSCALCATIGIRCIVAIVELDYTAHRGSSAGVWRIVATYGLLLYSAVMGTITAYYSAKYVYYAATHLTEKEFQRLRMLSADDLPGFRCGLECARSIFDRLCCRWTASRLDRESQNEQRFVLEEKIAEKIRGTEKNATPASLPHADALECHQA
jgi:hypothetical protein